MAHPNIFLLGNTKTGKTSVAKLLCQELSLTHVTASSWARRGFSAQGEPPKDPGDFVRAITQYSIQRLQEDPDVCIKDVQAQAQLSAGDCLIEGARNPRDFMFLFDYRKDLVVLLKNSVSVAPATPFEAGIEVILAYLRWLSTSGIAAERLLVESLSSYEEIPEVAARCSRWLKDQR